MNELLKAAESSSDSSEERYDKLKREEAGTDMSKAEERYQKLKQEAKEEMLSNDHEDKHEESNDEENEGESEYVTF